MSTIDDLRIQRDCALGKNVTGQGLINRGRALQSGFFANQSTELLAAIRKRTKGNTADCDCMNGGTCNCTDGCNCKSK